MRRDTPRVSPVPAVREQLLRVRTADIFPLQNLQDIHSSPLALLAQRPEEEVLTRDVLVDTTTTLQLLEVVVKASNERFQHRQTRERSFPKASPTGN